MGDSHVTRRRGLTVAARLRELADRRGDTVFATSETPAVTRSITFGELFSGYLDDPATTDDAIVERRGDGFVWFDTGDRATVDDHGFHYFAGRRSDVLKVAGENVSIVEVEQTLAEHPWVVEVAVIGAPDDVRDEVPEAFVVVNNDGHDDADVEAGLRAWADQHLAPSKRPRAYHVVDELPRTSVGKIRKFLLDPGSLGHPGTDQQATERTET